MHRLRSLSFVACVSLAACGGASNPTNQDSSVVVPDGGGSNPDLADDRVMIGASIGPIDLSPGQERTVCSRYRMSNDAAIDIVRLSAVLKPGSHHLIFYKSKETTEQKDLYDCPPLDISSGDIPIYIAETEMNNTLPLPTGAAYHFEAHEMVRLEAHYLNASTNPIVGMGSINLTVGDSGKTYERADIMFCGSVTPLYQGIGPGVPPGESTLDPGFYKPPAGIKVFGLTTHQHKRGSLMEIEKSTGLNVDGTNLTMGKPYDNPPFVIYTDENLLTFGPGEGLRWRCSYNNKGSKTYYFGQSAEDEEMCFLWAYYYPSVGRFLEKSDCWR